MNEEYDIAILGGGISGFTAALRLQRKGFKTIV
jgi:flavin-dependent dehydrogenase